MKYLQALVAAVSVGIAAGLWWPVIAPRIWGATLCAREHRRATTINNPDGSITMYCELCHASLTMNIIHISDVLNAQSLFDLPKVEPKPYLN